MLVTLALPHTQAYSPHHWWGIWRTVGSHHPRNPTSRVTDTPWQISIRLQRASGQRDSLSNIWVNEKNRLRYNTQNPRNTKRCKNQNQLKMTFVNSACTINRRRRRRYPIQKLRDLAPISQTLSEMFRPKHKRYTFENKFFFMIIVLFYVLSKNVNSYIQSYIVLLVLLAKIPVFYFGNLFLAF